MPIVSAPNVLIPELPITVSLLAGLVVQTPILPFQNTLNIGVVAHVCVPVVTSKRLFNAPVPKPFTKSQLPPEVCE